jgi:hypothetical protein
MVLAERVARLGCYLLGAGIISMVASMLLRNPRKPPRIGSLLLVFLGLALIMGAVFCAGYETGYYGF